MSGLSTLDKLKNKIQFRLKKAIEDTVNDPEANAVIEREKEKKEKTEPLTPQQAGQLIGNTVGDPNTFSMSRLLEQIKTQIGIFFEKMFFPFLCIMMSMFVVNEMIMYSAPIRIIFFIFVLVISLKMKLPAILLVIYYLLKGAYSYYLNHLSDHPPTKIMPTIFAVLPIIKQQPTTSLGALLLYPFIYPKNDKDAITLDNIMKKYETTLIESFPYVEEMKKSAEDRKKIEKAAHYLETLHKESKTA